MKKKTDERRPGFALMKLSGAVSYFHMQMPRWLFCDARYACMSLEAKVAYTFLLNRYQLSRRNGWVNRHGEVYVIYTREDLSHEMQISYRKAIACFKELADKQLIWEQRQGRGLPNRIFLAEVILDDKDSYSYDCAPFSTEPRPAKIALPDGNGSSIKPEDSSEMQDDLSEIPPDTAEGTEEKAAETAKKDLRKKKQIKKKKSISAGADTALPELPERHASKKDKSKKETRNTDDKDPTVLRADDGRGSIQAILQQCALSRYEPEEASVFRDAVAWLYYCGRLQLGVCTYPQGYVRETLRRLNPDVLDDALYKLRQNENEALSNTLVYTAKIIFSTILEMGSEALLDPVINRTKRRLG